MAVTSGASGGGRGSAIRAGQAFVELATRDKGLKSGLDGARRMVMSWGRGIAAAGAGLIGLGGAVLAPILGSFKSVLDRLTSVYDLSQRLGAATEDVSALGYAAKQTGSSMEEMAVSAAIMQDNLINQPQLFEAIGLSADELKKKGLADQFQAVADALSSLDKEAATAMARDIFGRAGGRLIPMLRELRQLRGRASLVGAVVTSEDAANADRVADSFDDLFDSLKFGFQSVAAAILPQADSIARWTDVALGVIRDTREWISANRELVLGIAAGAAALIALGVVLTGVGAGFIFLGAAIGGVGAVIGLLLSPLGIALGLFAAAIAAAYLLIGVTDEMRLGLSELSAAWQVMGEQLQTTLGGVSKALKAGRFKLALEIFTVGVELLWVKFVTRLQMYWTAFIRTLVSSLKVVAPELSKAIADTAGDLDAARKKNIEKRLDLEERQRRLLGKADMAAGMGFFAQQRIAQEAALQAFMNLHRQPGRAGQAGQAAKAVSAYGATRGAFAGVGIGSELAAAGESIENKQLDEQKKTNEKLDKIRDKLGGVPVD